MSSSAQSESFSPASRTDTALPSIGFATARAILLLTLFMFGNYWLNRHVGWGFDGPVFGFLMAGAGLVFALLDASLGESFRKEWMRRVGRVLLDFPVLLALWVALLLGALVCSSLTLVGDNAGEPLEASLTSVDGGDRDQRKEDNKDDKNRPVHFYKLWTTPMGKTYRLSVAGYLSTVVEVYPILGATITPRRDLRTAPSVLFRPPEGALGTMEGTVRVEVYETKNGQRTLIGYDEHVGSHSILVGYQRTVPTSLLESWRMEALAEGISDQRELAKLLQEWKTPFFLALKTGQPEPGENLELIVYSPGKQPIAKGKVRVTTEALQDVALQPVQGAPAAASTPQNGGQTPQ
jgi:hypothetical protein